VKVGDLVKLRHGEHYGIVISLGVGDAFTHVNVRWCNPRNEEAGWVTNDRLYCKKNLEVVSEYR
jgi:hypothetical protein